MFEMNANGEFLSTDWRMRTTYRYLSQPVLQYDRPNRRFNLVEMEKAYLKCYVLDCLGFVGRVCRTAKYARYCLSVLNDGRFPMDERSWLLDSHYVVQRCYDESSGFPYSFFASGLRVKSFKHEVEATAWDKWYSRSRVLSLPEGKGFSSYRSYLDFRDAESLDKAHQERVYEIVNVLTGRDHGGPDDN